MQKNVLLIIFLVESITHLSASDHFIKVMPIKQHLIRKTYGTTDRQKVISPIISIPIINSQIMYMYSNNKTSEWLQSKTLQKIAIITLSRKLLSSEKENDSNEKTNLQRERSAIIEKMTNEKEENEESTIYSDIEKSGGMWLSPADINNFIRNCKYKDKVSVIQLQISYRKDILN